ncbi:MAG: hypothetical protein EOO73_34230 [Myxococcales bacterium]|nr:MAG: hypothetical protein EOO73_34230 [Myxococcales bacterium]
MPTRPLVYGKSTPEETARAAAELAKVQATRPLSPPSRLPLPTRVVSVGQLEAARDFYAQRWTGPRGSLGGDEHEEHDALSIVAA